MTVQFRTLPVFGSDQRSVAEIVNGVMNGKTNNTGNVTIGLSVTSTTINDARIGSNSVILFMPTNGNAASLISGGMLYVSSRGKGVATITHPTTILESTFAYAIIG
jgi:hypothetical protein